jgi:cobalamin biosynthesis protein CbiD
MAKNHIFRSIYISKKQTITQEDRNKKQIKTMKKAKTQEEIILGHLSKGKTISSGHAMINWQIMRLGSVINSLKTKGFDISSYRKMNSSGTASFSVYYIKKEILDKVNKINFI